MKQDEGAEKRVREIREYFSLSQDQFAKKVGRTKGYISNIENGHAGMSSFTVAEICSAFSLSEDWLRTGTGEMFLPGQEQERPKPPSKEGIAKRVRDIRKKAGLTQLEFGRRIGL